MASTVHADDAADARAETLESIVVTARHRAEDSQKVPIAMAVLSAEELEKNPGELTLKQIQARIPSLQILGFSGRAQSPTIRGLGSQPANSNEGVEQGVGIYIDDVFYARSGIVLTDLVGLESVAVLRGPQGTLFGKNTAAGAIDIHTRPASLTPAAEVEVSRGNYDYVQARLSATGPLSDSLAGQIHLSRSTRDGVIYNRIFKDQWEDRENWNARADLVFEPSEAFRYRLIADTHLDEGHTGLVYVIRDVLPATLDNGAAVRDYYRKAADIGYDTPLPAFGSRNTDIDDPTYSKMKSSGITGRGDWQLGSLQLVSISGWREFSYLPIGDGDFIGAPVLGDVRQDVRQSQVSQEFRLSGQTETLEYTAGLYWLRQDVDGLTSLTYLRDGAKWYIGAAADPNVLNGLTTITRAEAITDSYAAYGQSTWHISDALSLTAGLRYTYEHKSGSYASSQRLESYGQPIADFPSAQQPGVTATRNAFAASAAYNAALNDSNTSGLLTLGYEFSPRSFGYATASTGYKSAAINLVARNPGVDIYVQPEEVRNLELGVKSSLLDQRLFFNANVFWTEADDFQATVLYVAPTGQRANYLGNAAKVRSRGVEIETRFLPTPGLTLGFASAFTDAEYTSYPSTACPYLQSYQSSCDLSGAELPGTPRWSLSGSIDYSRPIGTRGLESSIGTAWHYQTDYFSTANDDPYARVPGYAVFDVTARLQSSQGRWALTLWGRNVFDKQYYHFVTINTATVASLATLGEPRSYGVSLQIRL